MKAAKKVIKAFTSFLFPPLCLHCQSALSATSPFFCPACLPFFELIDPEQRCTRCFKALEKKALCTSCRLEKRGHVVMGAAFEYQGPTATLVKLLKGGNAPYLAKTAAAWLTLQFERLGWPHPDAIVPVPAPWLKSVWRGKDHAAFIAQELSGFLKVPLIQPLWRKSGDIPQGKRNQEQRLLLTAESFQLKRTAKLADKTLLIVDDVMTTGTTLRCMSEVLMQGFPRKLYALTLCM